MIIRSDSINFRSIIPFGLKIVCKTYIFGRCYLATGLIVKKRGGYQTGKWYQEDIKLKLISQREAEKYL